MRLFLLPCQLRNQWRRLALCPAKTALMGATIWCELIHSCGPHRHGDIEWDDDVDTLASDDPLTYPGDPRRL